jgi:hypothetical protein
MVEVVLDPHPNSTPTKNHQDFKIRIPKILP